MEAWSLETEQPKAAVVNGSLLLMIHICHLFSFIYSTFIDHLCGRNTVKFQEYNKQTDKVSVLKKFLFHPLNAQLSKFPTPHSIEIPVAKSLLLDLLNKTKLSKTFL